jgi:hypothetical protein
LNSVAHSNVLESIQDCVSLSLQINDFHSSICFEPGQTSSQSVSSSVESSEEIYCLRKE